MTRPPGPARRRPPGPLDLIGRQIDGELRQTGARVGRSAVWIGGIVLGTIAWFLTVVVLATPLSWLGVIDAPQGPAAAVLGIGLFVAGILVATWVVARWVRAMRPLLHRMDRLEAGPSGAGEATVDDAARAKPRTSPAELAALDARLAAPATSSSLVAPATSSTDRSPASPVGPAEPQA